MIRAYGLVQFATDVYVPSRLNLGARAEAELLRAVRQLEEFAGPLHPDDFSDDLVCRWMRARRLAGDSPTTINAKRSKVLAVWRCAWRKGLHPTVPRDIPRMREPQDPPQARSTEDIERLAKHCSTLTGQINGVSRAGFWRSLFLAVAATGERPWAVVRALTADCDLAHRYLIVKSSTTKTARGRLYELAPWAAEAIAAIYDQARERLWPWPHCRRHFYTRARRIMEDAGLKPRKDCKDLFYSLKRWNLSHLAAESLELAREQAGHSSAAITLRYYIDPRIAKRRSAADVLPPVRG